MNQPLVRWTIGRTSPLGFETLQESVFLFASLYPEFRRVICYNHLTPIQIEKLTKLPAFLIPQAKTNDLVNLNIPITSGWKLIPPRLNPAQHELWIDNDLVLTQRIEEIDEWLSSSTGIICEGKHRLFGRYDWAVISGYKICAGLFGLPPYFDFATRIAQLAYKLNKQPIKSFDEQGLTAAIVTEIPGFILIPRTQIELCDDLFLPGSAVGYHFVGVNRMKRHRPWLHYKMINQIPLL